MQDAQNYLEWPVKHSLLDWLTAVIWNQNSRCSDKSSLVSTNCELCKYYDDITSSTFYNQAFQMWHLMTDTLIYTFITTTHVYYTQINCYNLFSAFIVQTILVSDNIVWRWRSRNLARWLLGAKVGGGQRMPRPSCCAVLYWLQLASGRAKTRNNVMIPTWAAPSNSHSSSLPHGTGQKHHLLPTKKCSCSGPETWYVKFMETRNVWIHSSNLIHLHLRVKVVLSRYFLIAYHKYVCSSPESASATQPSAWWRPSSPTSRSQTMTVIIVTFSQNTILSM